MLAKLSVNTKTCIFGERSDCFQFRTV